MRTRSQRHLASARESSLLAWLPRPRSGARSPLARHHLPAPVSRSWVYGEASAPLGWGSWGDAGSAVILWHSRGRGAGVRIPSGRGRVSSRATSPTWRGDIWPLLSGFVPHCRCFPPCLLPGRRFLVSLLNCRPCVCWQRWRWCWPAREAPRSPGSSSQAAGHTGKGDIGPLLWGS